MHAFLLMRKQLKQRDRLGCSGNPTNVYVLMLARARMSLQSRDCSRALGVVSPSLNVHDGLIVSHLLLLFREI